MAKGGCPTTADSFHASHHMSLVHISTYMCLAFVRIYIQCDAIIKLGIGLRNLMMSFDKKKHHKK